MTTSSALLALGPLLVALYGGLLALERRAALLMMLSQPIVSVTLLGLILQAPLLGQELAIRLQLLWMGSVLFGLSPPPNEHLVSMVIGGGALLAQRGLHADLVEVEPMLLIALAFLLGSPFAPLGGYLDRHLNRRFDRLNALADEAAQRGETAALSRLVRWALWHSFWKNALVILVGCGLLSVALWLLAGQIGGAPKVALTAFASYALPSLGLATSFALIKRRRALLLGLFAFALSLLSLPSGALRP